jgi:hypothetical protein
MDLTQEFENWRQAGDRLSELIRQKIIDLDQQEADIKQLAEGYTPAIREQGIIDGGFAMKHKAIEIAKSRREQFEDKSPTYKLLSKLIEDFIDL